MILHLFRRESGEAGERAVLKIPAAIKVGASKRREAIAWANGNTW